jgi:hypothetical protein
MTATEGAERDRIPAKQPGRSMGEERVPGLLKFVRPGPAHFTSAELFSTARKPGAYPNEIQPCWHSPKHHVVPAEPSAAPERPMAARGGPSRVEDDGDDHRFPS